MFFPAFIATQLRKQYITAEGWIQMLLVLFTYLLKMLR
jgi:uncharacterized membrane protein YqaE (UPF0057 family)